MVSRVGRTENAVSINYNFLSYIMNQALSSLTCENMVSFIHNIIAYEKYSLTYKLRIRSELFTNLPVEI